MEKSYPTVTQLVSKIKYNLESNFNSVIVQGEISNLTQSATGHWYFTLSDKDASLSIALFKMDSFRNPYIKKVKNGDQVLLSGNIGVYSKRGTFQLIAKSVSALGAGDLNAQFEMLKAKLSAQGLFDTSVKKQIPKMPKNIAVITGESSAAWADFKNVFHRRSFFGNLMLVPALVQGDTAPKSIIKALDKIEEYCSKGADIDLVILTRGGGSMEDLWCFNDEQLARKIFSFSIPVISAVGHEVDFTISDFVSDLRLETPTAAAETITNEQFKIKNKMTYLIKSLTSDMNLMMSEYRETLGHCQPNKQVENIWKLLNKSKQKLHHLSLEHRAPELLSLHELKIQLEEYFLVLNDFSTQRLGTLVTKIENLMQVLKVLDPKNVLTRGYSYISDKDNRVITSNKNFKQVNSQEKLNIHFADGIGEVTK